MCFRILLVQLVLDILTPVNNIILIIIWISNNNPATFVRIFFHGVQVDFIQLFFLKWRHDYFGAFLIRCQIVLGNFIWESGVGPNNQIIRYSNLTGHAKIVWFLFQLIRFDLISRFKLSGQYLYGAGST